MAQFNKRYFVKRESTNSEPEVSKPPFQFPHFFRSIPALPFKPGNTAAYVFHTLVYSCIIFFALVQIRIFFPVSTTANSFSDDLVTSPKSYRSHLLYLESLTVKNRLEEAQHEVAFLHVAQEVLVPTQEELSALRTLEESISARKIVFHTTIGEYNHWNDISKTHPDYRDVLYRLGQKSYMLFDDAHARVLVQEAVNMDPQFLQGEKVLNLLGQ